MGEVFESFFEEVVRVFVLYLPHLDVAHGVIFVGEGFDRGEYFDGGEIFGFVALY